MSAVVEDRAAVETEEYGRTYRKGEFLPFYVPRPFMPQIDMAKYPQFIADALPRGVTFDVVPVNSLHAHQRVLHFRASAMPDEARLKPIIVSSDGYIVDGNHRWWAHVYQHAPLIAVIRLGLPFKNAVDWALTLPYVYCVSPQKPGEN